MSTNDVPGAVDSHNDELAMGCWAEHNDGSLLFVQSTEGGRVIYMMFDTTEDPIVEYRDAMPEKQFKKTFSYNPKKKDSIQWTWHDKTAFPWDRVIKTGAKAGQHHASAGDQLRSAERVARSRHLKGSGVDESRLQRIRDGLDAGASSMTSVIGRTGNRIKRGIQAAIDEMRT